ncbi:TTC21B [Acanthosepion pharaonis]|uniref:TTC21B n=1 Tax=Acanthosepion pharaonis TaxID=158019 RepID=A0A812CLR2_ACAPH|nr:TTC21B [Sepia pharaonis]
MSPLVLAAIHLHLNNFKLAAQSLEFGLSHNFQVREHPVYHLIRAQIQKKQNELTDAIQTLQYAMGLPGMKASGKPSVREKIHVNVNDRVSVFLELADTHRLLGQQHEAAKVMQDAINEFQGSPEEVRITIANVDLALARGDIELALGTLRNVSPEQQYFVQAREKMADIYLNYRNDKRLYANCYRELVEKKPSVHTSLLLGDAYMSIQEPEKAIEIYESALRLNPKDTTLASKIVLVDHLVNCIHFHLIDLAELLLRLKQHEKAEKILRQTLEQDVKYTDLDVMKEQAKCLHLLTKICQQTNRSEDALLFFTKAKEMQIRVYQRVQTEQPDMVPVQRQMITKLCCEMAQHAMNYSDYEHAVASYKEALTYNEGDGRNDAATIMLADLSFSRNDYENSLKHYKQLLTTKPDNYEVLAKLVDLLRRSGNLEDAADFLETAKETSPHSKTDAGFNYCLGLYDWYTGRSTAALKCFNMARKDTVWGNRAIFNMVEICLNPDSDTIGGEVFESVEGQTGMDKMKLDNEQVALRTAEKLLKEVKPRNGNIRLQLMENMVLVASKTKSNVEKALTSFMEVASLQKDNVGALYGMATAYMVQKQVPKARNQLKRVSKSNWTLEDAEDLEKSWLLLADIYIQSSKYDMSNELLKKCLQYNKVS